MDIRYRPLDSGVRAGRRHLGFALTGNKRWVASNYVEFLYWLVVNLIIIEIVMSRRRVVVTGLGVLSPIGVNLGSYWDALVEGKSGVSYLTSIKTDLPRRPIGSEVPDFKPKDYIKPKKNVKIMSRDIQMGVVATLLACQNAGLNFDPDQESAPSNSLY